MQHTQGTAHHELSLLDNAADRIPHTLSVIRSRAGADAHQSSSLQHDMLFIQAASDFLPAGGALDEGDDVQIDDTLPGLSTASDALSALRTSALTARNSTGKSFSESSGTGFIGHSTHYTSAPSRQIASLRHTLQNEARFWALLSALHSHDFGRGASPQAEVPLDSAAHHARVGELAVGGDATLLLLNALVAWGQGGHTVHVALPSHATDKGDMNTSMASLAAENTRRAKHWAGTAAGVPDLFAFLGPDVLEESSDGVPGTLLGPHLAPPMWMQTRSAGARGSTDGAPLQQLRCDPDGPTLTRQSLLAEDAATERDLASSMWSLVRGGHVVYARLLAQLYGQPWRSAVLLGPQHPLDTHQRGVPDPTLFASLGFVGGAGPNAGAEEAALRVVDLVRRGNTEHAVWQRLAARQATALLDSSSPGAVHESALLALMSGSVDTLVRNTAAVPSWWDALWAVAQCALRQKVDYAVSEYVQARRVRGTQHGRPSANTTHPGKLVACDVPALLQVLDAEMAVRDESVGADELGASRGGPMSETSFLDSSLDASRSLGGFSTGVQGGVPGGARLLEDSGTAWSVMASAAVLHAADVQATPALMQSLVAATTHTALASTVAAAASAQEGDAGGGSRTALLASSLQRVTASFAASRSGTGRATGGVPLSAQGAGDASVLALVTPVLRAAAHAVLYLRNHGALRQLPCPAGSWPAKESCRGTSTAGHGMPPLDCLGGGGGAGSAFALWQQGDTVIARYATHLMRCGQLYAAVFMCSHLHHSAGVSLLASCLAGQAVCGASAGVGPVSAMSLVDKATLDPCSLVEGALPVLVAVARLAPLWLRPVVRAACAALAAAAQAPPSTAATPPNHANQEVPWAASAGIQPQHVLGMQAVALGMAAVRARTLQNARDVPSSAPPAWEFAVDCAATGNTVSRWLALQVASAQPLQMSARAAVCVLYIGLPKSSVGTAAAVPAVLPEAVRDMLQEELEQGTEEEQVFQAGSEGGLASPPVRGPDGVAAVNLEASSWAAFVRFQAAHRDWMASVAEAIPEATAAGGRWVAAAGGEAHTAAATRAAVAVQAQLQALREAAAPLLEPHAQWGLWLSQCPAGANVQLEHGELPPSVPGQACAGSNAVNDALTAVGVARDSPLFREGVFRPAKHTADVHRVRGVCVSWALSLTQEACLVSARWALAAGWPASGGTSDARQMALGTQEALLPHAAAWAALAVDCLATVRPEHIQSAWWAHVPPFRLSALSKTGLAAASLLASMPVQLQVSAEAFNWAPVLGAVQGARPNHNLGQLGADVSYAGSATSPGSFADDGPFGGVQGGVSLRTEDLEDTAEEGDFISRLANE